VDQTGEIKYCEFLAATIEATGAISAERLAEAFDRLDSDDSGYISADSLRELLGNNIPQEEINAIIKEADLNNDNRISYAEFLALWEDKNEEKREIMIEDLHKHKASLTSISEDSKSSHREDVSDDSDSENHPWSHFIYIERKMLSEGRVSKLSEISAEDMKQFLYDESNVSIKRPKDDAHTESVGYENLLTAMRAAA
jgi:predicted HTH domain antitoxin